MREPRFAPFGRLVETAATAGRRGPAAELFALVHRRRAQAPGRTSLAVGGLQWVHVQVGVVDATAVTAPVPGQRPGHGGRFEHGVVCRRQVTLRMERLRLAADVRVRAVDAAHLVARTPLATATGGRRRAVLRLERPHLHAERRRPRRLAGRIRREVFRIQILLHLLLM